MSHHFDTPTAREDPRLNLCDMYLFAGSPTSTVMIMTVNPAATAQTTNPFRDEAIYAFHFDTDGGGDGDGVQNVSFKLRFTDASASQRFDVIHSTTGDHGLDGDVIATGMLDVTGEGTVPGVRTFAGVVHDAFAGDAAALEKFKVAFVEGHYDPDSFDNHTNFFHGRTVAVIVLEVPNRFISKAIRVHAWSTISLFGHAPAQQVARWGLPLFTHLFLGNPELNEQFNRSKPADNAVFRTAAAATISAYTRAAGTAADPEAYGRRVAALFGSLNLPYRLGTAAAFDFAGINGRALGDNVMDNMLTLLTNSPLGTGIGPDHTFFDSTFPYLRSASDLQSVSATGTVGHSPISDGPSQSG